ncbi:MAG: autotransporter strand-loop-strand O-heptosyltransferase [Acetobacteraceae bacterium]|nr:autotransporter strand-loop-strand O-heptosyltransferase [Acetobacteraceae bacterium]
MTAETPSNDPDATATAASSSRPEPEAKPPYPPASATPVLIGPDGIRFDFNLGCRVMLPPRTEGRWRVRLRDLDTGNILFESENQGAFVNSAKRWYVRFRVEIWSIDDAKPDEPNEVMTHDHDPAHQDVLIQFPVGTLGDILAWFPYANRFAEKFPTCRVTCAMSGLIIPLLRDAYPNLRLVTHEEMVEQQLAEIVYATYSMGVFFGDEANDWQPTDFRLVGLHRTAGYILGVDPTEVAPRLALPDETRPIDEPYAVIAVQSSSGCKYWTNPNGWREVVAFLKEHGYRVICVDQKPVHGFGLMWTPIPNGAEDQTGDRPLAERARLLRHASLFIGLSSGLSWLAWAAGCPVVLISGFTHPTNEFETPYRVINWHACNSCWNDPRHKFDHKDFLWCPRHRDTPRQFECTRLITPSHVRQAIETIPGFGAHAEPKPG